MNTDDKGKVTAGEWALGFVLGMTFTAVVIALANRPHVEPRRRSR